MVREGQGNKQGEGPGKREQTVKDEEEGREEAEREGAQSSLAEVRRIFAKRSATIEGAAAGGTQTHARALSLHKAVSAAY